MKRIGFVFVLAVVALTLCGSALAQGDNSVYFVTYYSNNSPVVTGAKGGVASAPDETVRLINDGDTGGNLWADFYVFDDSEEMSECCQCKVTPDGLLSESVQYELATDPLTGIIHSRGVIKIISDGAGVGPASPSPQTGLRGWATHVQKAGSAFAVTEAPLADANLTGTEEAGLGLFCGIMLELGSGRGVCTCTNEDNDF